MNILLEQISVRNNSVILEDCPTPDQSLIGNYRIKYIPGFFSTMQVTGLTGENINLIKEGMRNFCF